MSYTYYKRYQPSHRRGGFKSFFWLVVFLVFFFLVLRACVSVFSSFAEDKKDEAVLSVLNGNAEILEWGQSEAKSASDSELVLVGDQISTGDDSMASLTFHNGTVIHLDENTKLKIAEFTKGEGEGERGNRASPSGDQMKLQLLDGRIWVAHQVQDEGEFELFVQTDIMNLRSFQDSYLVSNKVDNELLAVRSGQVSVDFVDRGEEELVIESLTIKEGEQSSLNDEKERELLARENVTLVEPVSVTLWEEDFIKRANGQKSGNEVDAPIQIEGEKEEAPQEPEESLEVIDSAELTISVSSPASGATIQKDAFAIEGQIVSGTASKVTVTWSGNGEPFVLGLFEAGNSSFRYVADTDYLNLSKGSNTYTVVAYDAAGLASNTITLTVTASF